MRATAILLLVGCDAGERKPPPAPMPKPVPGPTLADAGVVSIDASTIPTPADRNLRIDVRVKSETSEAECTRSTLRLRLIDKTTKATVDAFDETSTCQGACTAQEKREGEEHIAAVERAIERDEATPSELDYNFTGCLETGYGEHQKFRNIGGRDIVVFTDRYLGPHDGEYHRLRLATEVCGKLFVTDTFADAMNSSWDIDKVLPIAEGDGAFSIYGEETQKGTLLRVKLPPCPGLATQEAFDIHPIYDL